MAPEGRKGKRWGPPISQVFPLQRPRSESSYASGEAASMGRGSDSGNGGEGTERNRSHAAATKCSVAAAPACSRRSLARKLKAKTIEKERLPGKQAAEMQAASAALPGAANPDGV